MFRIIRRLARASAPTRRNLLPRQFDRPMPREMRFPLVPTPLETVISGKCWVIDGDTIVINKTHIRLAGIDAPELDHPWGQQSKWAMVRLCRGQTITARIKPEMSYDRVVGECFLPDGRDLAVELVKLGLALDWPKFSGGKYRHFETPDARKKLWRAALRQSGVVWPTDAPPQTAPHAPQPLRAAPPLPPVIKPWPPPRPNYWLGWLAGCLAIVLLVGCQLIGGEPTPSQPADSQQVWAFQRFEVTANALNIRERPTSHAGVLGQLGSGTIITPKQMSGSWYGIEMTGGRMGWVHSDFLRRIGD